MLELELELELEELELELELEELDDVPIVILISSFPPSLFLQISQVAFTTLIPSLSPDFTSVYLTAGSEK